MHDEDQSMVVLPTSDEAYAWSGVGSQVEGRPGARLNVVSYTSVTPSAGIDMSDMCPAVRQNGLKGRTAVLLERYAETGMSPNDVVYRALKCEGIERTTNDNWKDDVVRPHTRDESRQKPQGRLPMGKR